MKIENRVFVWKEGVLTQYGDGLVVIIARTVEEARDDVRARLGNLKHDLSKMGGMKSYTYPSDGWDKCHQLEIDIDFYEWILKDISNTNLKYRSYPIDQRNIWASVGSS